MGDPTEKKIDLFLSYNSRDRTIGERVVRALEARGLTVFWDQKYLVPGKSWPEALEQALANCRAVVVLYGSKGYGYWHRKESDLALDLQRRDPKLLVIPVLLPGVFEPPASFLLLNTCLELGGDEPLVMDKLASVIRGAPSLPSALLEETVCPYRGLRYFREEDAPFFRGRDAAIELLLKKLKQQTVIAVVGASGSGKSSIVRAGLVPRLRRDSGGQVWDAITIVPGVRPLEALAGSIVSLLEAEMTEVEQENQVGILAKGFEEGTAKLRRLVEKALQKQTGTDRFLLIVDQWEELYSSGADPKQVRRFLEEILDATSPDAHNPLSVVLTVRADFFGHILEGPLAGLMQEGMVNLAPMTLSELERAIAEPSKMVGLAFEPGLKERILTDVGQEPGNLALLQFVLWELWDQRREDLFLHAVYDRIGGALGAIAHKAEEAYESLSESDKRLVQQVFVELIHVGDRAPDTRRRVNLVKLEESLQNILIKLTPANGALASSLLPTVQRVLRTLVTARLIVTDRNAGTGEETIEVAHEALISKWGRLRDWLKEDRDFLLWKQRLQGKLKDRGKGELLKGSTLTEARKWLSERFDDVGADEISFIKESLRGRLRARVAIVIILLALLGSSLVSVVQHERALAKGQVAFARQLAQQAKDLQSEKSPESLQLSALLATESLKRLPSSEADLVLRHALGLLPRVITNLTQKSGIKTINYSWDGTYLATVSRDKAAQVWDSTTWVHKDQATAGESNATAVTFGPDGQLFALGRDDGRVRLCELQTGLTKSDDLNHGESVSRVIFSTNGQCLATVGFETVRIWSVQSGKLITGTKFTSAITSFALTADGKRYAASTNGMVMVWNAISGQLIARWPHGSSINALTFDPDGKLLVSVGNDGICVWTVGEPEVPCRIDYPKGIRSAVFSHDGKQFAVGGLDGMVGLWNAKTSTNIFLQRGHHISEVMAVVFSPDDRYIATASRDETAIIWEVNSGNEIARMIHDDVVESVAFSPNGREVATASADRTARIWGVRGYVEAVRVSDSNQLKSIAFSDNGKSFVTVGLGKSAVMWASEDGREIARTRLDFEADSVAISAGGKYIAIGCRDGKVLIWDPLGSNPVRRFKIGPSDGGATRVAFGGNGNLLAAGGIDGAKVWEMPDPGEKLILTNPGTIISITISPDQKLLAASCGKSARIWDLANGRPVLTLEQEKTVDAVAFSPDAAFLATAGADNSATIWEARNGRRITLLPHSKRVLALAFSPNGKYLATGSADGTARVWEWRTRQEIARIFHDKEVESVAFNQNGRLLGTASDDGTARLWIWQPEDLIAEASHRLTRNLTTNEWAQYMGNEPYQKRFRNLP